MSVTMPERELTPANLYLGCYVQYTVHTNLHMQQCTNVLGPFLSFYEQTSSVCSSASTAIRVLQLTIYVVKRREIGNSYKKQKRYVRLCTYTCRTVSQKSTHPNFWPHFLYRIKVYSNKYLPWSELWIKFEKHSLKCYAYLR